MNGYCLFLSKLFLLRVLPLIEVKRAFAIFALSSALALAAPAAAIVGPTIDASHFEDEVVMVLTRGPQGSGFCTGIVLSPTVVLTAAHCLRQPNDMLVHFRDAMGTAVVMDVVAATPNPGYHPNAAVSRSRSIDIGLIRMRSPLPSRFRAALLPTGSPPSPGDQVTAVGFGVSDEFKPATGGTLRKAKLMVREPRSSVLLWLKGIGGDGGACAGDSGGPIFAPDGATLVAVIAWTEGHTGASCGMLTQAVLVGPISEWISANLSNLDKP